MRVRMLFLTSLLLCSTSEAAEVVLAAKTSLSFERQSDGQIVADFDLQFTNTTGKTLCMLNGTIPGSDSFNPAEIRFVGPRGPLQPIEDSSRYTRAPIASMVGSLIVLFRDRRITTGIRVLAYNYKFEQAGRYTAELNVPLFDCSKLGQITDISDRYPGWFLGNLVARAEATLK